MEGVKVHNVMAGQFGFTSYLGAREGAAYSSQQQQQASSHGWHMGMTFGGHGKPQIGVGTGYPAGIPALRARDHRGPETHLLAEGLV